MENHIFWVKLPGKNEIGIFRKFAVENRTFFTQIHDTPPPDFKTRLTPLIVEEIPFIYNQSVYLRNIFWCCKLSLRALSIDP